MDIFVLDIGCSNTKGFVFRNDTCMERWERPTPPDAADLIETSVALLSKATADGYEINRCIVISHSDAIVYDDANGFPKRLLISEPIPFQQGLAPFVRTGKPLQHDLKGIANQLLWLTHNKIKPTRVLPVSAYIASVFAGDTAWNTWDITHASNSGAYDNIDWKYNDAAKPFIDSGAMCGKVKAPDTRIPNTVGIEVLLGGHDTLFGISHEPNPTPYVACGTWITASVPANAYEYSESGFINIQPINKQHPTPVRYLRDVNGNLHRQTCFKPNEKTVEWINRHFGCLSPNAYIPVFGSWSAELSDRLGTGRFMFTDVDPDGTYLQQHAARYARGV